MSTSNMYKNIIHVFIIVISHQMLEMQPLHKAINVDSDDKSPNSNAFRKDLSDESRSFTIYDYQWVI